MSKSLIITDVEFVQLPELFQKNHLYLYRKNSALLRTAVRAKVTRQAELDGRGLRDIATQEERLPSLYVTVAEPSLLDETLAVLDLGDRTLKHPPLDDIELALDLIAKDAAQQSLCLLVPTNHEVVKTDAWRAAVDTIGLIEEPMVTLDNYLAVARCYFPQSRLGDLSQLSDNRRFLTRLRKFVEQATCTPFELSLQVDMIVLGEMENGEFLRVSENETQRAKRWVLPETLRRFLDNRDAASFSALMHLVDGMRHDRMLEPHELVTRLYRATAATLESRDKRYRRVDDPLHCVWAALLLASERNFLNGDVFVSMDVLCQSYGRQARATAWLASSAGWQAIGALLEIEATEKRSRLDSARIEVQRTLRVRLGAMAGEDIEWFQCLARWSGGQEAVDLLNERALMTAGDME